MQIVWTAPAVGDLEAARDFVGMDNQVAARQQVMRVLHATRRWPERL